MIFNLCKYLLTGGIILCSEASVPLTRYHIKQGARTQHAAAALQTDTWYCDI